MKIRESHVLLTILFLSMAGMGLAVYLVANHYQYAGIDWCRIGGSDCQEVNTGEWSTTFGIPWSVIGLAGFVIVFALAYVRLYYPHLDSKERLIPLLLLFSTIGIVFVIYLNYLEVFVIHKICLLCAISHVIMVVILWLLAWWHFFGRLHVIDEDVEEKSITDSDETESL